MVHACACAVCQRHYAITFLRNSISGGNLADGGSRNGPDDGYGGGRRYGGDYWGGWGQRVYNPGDIRQFRDQARYWANEAQQLRDQLRNDGVNTGDLDEILRQMRQLDDDRVYRDAKEKWKTPRPISRRCSATTRSRVASAISSRSTTARSAR